jgi:hypothetical protein
MDSLSLALVVCVLFLSLVAFFSTVKWGVQEVQGQARTCVHEPEQLHADCLRLQRPRPRSVPGEFPPVLRQNVAVARLMRMDGVLFH